MIHVPLSSKQCHFLLTQFWSFRSASDTKKFTINTENKVRKLNDKILHLYGYQEWPDLVDRLHQTI